MPDDAHLLAAFIRDGSAEAFRLLVERHIDLVHAAARRQARDGHEAQDITQAVFIVLARKAGGIRNAALLPAWLLKVTHFAARDARKAAARRRRHEQEVSKMTLEAVPPVDPEWEKLSPHLDAALARLSDVDRAAVIAHCIERRPIPEIAAALGLSEPAARKRVQRAVERLRLLLAGHATASAMALPAALAKYAVTPAPAGLAGAISTTALAALQGTAAAGGAVALAKGVSQMLFWTPMKIAAAGCLVAAVLVASTAIPLAMAQNTPAPAAAAAFAPATLGTIALPSGAKLTIDSIQPLKASDVAIETNLQDYHFVEVFFHITASADATAPVNSPMAQTARVIPPDGVTADRFSDRANNFPQSTRVILTLPPSAKTLAFRIDVASGDWKTRATLSVAPSSGGDYHFGKDLMSYSMREDANGAIVVECTDSFATEVGRLYAATDKSIQSAAAPGLDAPFRQIKIMLSKDSAKTLNFQTRPYNEFAEISKIPLDSLGKGELRGSVETGIITQIAGAAVAAVPDAGEYYLMGDIPRAGVYTTSGRQITVKQALAAGGEDGTVPETITLIRRMGTRERQYTLELDKILSGGQDDMFVEANDVIRVKKH